MNKGVCFDLPDGDDQSFTSFYWALDLGLRFESMGITRRVNIMIPSFLLSREWVLDLGPAALLRWLWDWFVLFTAYGGHIFHSFVFFFLLGRLEVVQDILNACIFSFTWGWILYLWNSHLHCEIHSHVSVKMHVSETPCIFSIGSRSYF